MRCHFCLVSAQHRSSCGRQSKFHWESLCAWKFDTSLLVIFLCSLFAPFACQNKISLRSKWCQSKCVVWNNPSDHGCTHNVYSYSIVHSRASSCVFYNFHQLILCMYSPQLWSKNGLNIRASNEIAWLQSKAGHLSVRQHSRMHVLWHWRAGAFII